jgi:glycosyltransferase involved in cell wall biosynthesis
MRVTFFQRGGERTYFSIERVFADVRAAMPEDINIRVAKCRFPSRGVWRRAYSVVEAVFRQGDVNHITGDVNFLTLLLSRARTVLTIHDLVSVHQLRGLRQRVYLLLWFWLPTRQAAAVTVISDATKRELLRHVRLDPEKVHVIHDCVSSDFQPAPKEFNKTRPIILQVGTRPNKNLERVIEALQGIACHLRVIGHLSDLQKAMLQRCRIEYSAVANISSGQVINEYRQCDMLVFASTYEGFGLPIIEAQATGRPVVTSDLLSMPEVAGDAACLVDPLDTRSIREGIMKVIGDEDFRDKLVHMGFENIKRFSSVVIARQYAQLYSQLCPQ